MKAKVIKTGEIINVIPVDGGWAANFINCTQHFEDSELDFNFEDWEAFHREAAKDIFCAIISTTNGATPGDITMAIEIADELIKQLKEKKK